MSDSALRRPRPPLPGLLALLLLPHAAWADPVPPEPLDAAGMRLMLERLQVVGSALYVAAHPDDENTALLAWLSKGRKVRAGYLSVTRGDGGQNLIGPDTGELLGVIRTQELLAARRVDGAEQFFTRALDFGYSKSADETLAKWGRERILADVVWVIRRFQPDVIVTRFPADGRGTHGHHTASAIVAEEAFAAAADPARFPEQLRHVRPWRARRLVWNVFRFGAAGPDTTPGRLTVDLGAYAPLLGRSFTEIAGESRSMHKSQGFGAAERRGVWTNAFEHRLGERATGDLFDGVDLTWSRVPGGARLARLLRQAAREFRPERPQAILPTLLRAHALMASVPDEPLVAKKREELLQVIRAAAGLWLEAIVLRPTVSPGGELRVATSALNRSDADVRLEGVELLDLEGALRASATPPRALAANVPASETLAVRLPADALPTRPYWLELPSLAGSSEVADARRIGDPEGPAVLRARFRLRLAGAPLAFDVPVVHRWIDPVQGERHRDLVVVPPAFLRFEHGAYLFADPAPRAVKLTVESTGAPVEGALRLELPEGWRAEPSQAAIRLGAGADTAIRFRVTPGPSPAAATMGAEIEIGGRSHGWTSVHLDYPHIPVQALALPAEARLVRAEVKRQGSRIGYVMGSGDEVPAALRQMGFQVTLLDDETLEGGDLSGYDAIVTGVRAYNTRPRLIRLQQRLLDYVAGGGRLVVQYNTAEPGLQDRLGPYPFRVSRERVTVEEAEMRLLRPGHPLLAAPNPIGPGDFEGWVQERGLYYASPWDERYETVLAASDPGEPAREGGVLYARYGRGVFIYTGLAWFRQLPAGVPGAYRLFANLVSAAR
jgi:LmbE family N-acetylglucosaminyl deacetylase